jgi:hypothetical protein
MKRLRTHQSGFGAVETLLIVIVVILVGVVSFMVYKNIIKPQAIVQPQLIHLRQPRHHQQPRRQLLTAILAGNPTVETQALALSIHLIGFQLQLVLLIQNQAISVIPSKLSNS